jgi:hypothetical protein
MPQGGESFINDKVFLRDADQCIEHVPGFRRKHAPYPAATEKIFAVEKRSEEERGDEITPSHGIPSTFLSRSVARVCVGIHARQGLAPRTLAPGRDFLPTKRAFSGYSKPSLRD